MGLAGDVTWDMAMASAAVVSIDLDIAMCQITGPDPRGTATSANTHADFDMLAGHMRGDRCLVIIVNPHAIGGNSNAADIDAKLRLIDGGAA